MIGEPGNLPSRRSSGGREEFSAGGKVEYLSFATTAVRLGRPHGPHSMGPFVVYKRAFSNGRQGALKG